MSNTGTDTRQRNPSPGKIRGRRPFIPQREGRISPAGKTDNVAPHMKYEVILYYYFHPIRNPEKFCKRHKKFLRELDVKGRVYINEEGIDRKSTRLNSSHVAISYAVFCLKKKKDKKDE